MPWMVAWVTVVLGVAAGVGAPRAQAIEPSGTFIQVPGKAPIYRVVGGAAVHVDSCAPLGGCPGIVDVANLNGYASRPANGSFLRFADGPSAGWIGEFVGGSPVHVDTCAPLGGCPGTVNIDSGGASDYIRAHPTPANGSFLRFADGPSAGWIGVVVGGSPVHVDTCAPLGGCPGTVNIDSGGASDYIRAHPTPANGSFLRFADGPSAGWIGRLVGGSPVHVDTCAPLGGCPGTVNIDSGGASDYIRAHPTPANGSFLRFADGPSAGWIGRLVGGSPIHVDSCAPLGGCPGTVNVDAAGANDYLHAHPRPANGSFVLAADGADAGEISRAAGGALIRLTDCAALGGCGGYVTLDGGGFVDYASAHPTPADGTLLRGVPSNTNWEVLAGERIPVAANAAAVPVNDAGLAAIPVAPTRSSGTAAQHVPAPRARRRIHVKMTLSWRWDRGRTQLVRVKLGKLGQGMTVRVRCTGRRCPHRAVAATARRAPRALRNLNGLVYRAGDRLMIVISARGRRPERVRVVFRYGRIPRAALLR